MGEGSLGCYTSLFAILLDTDPPRVWMDGLPIKIQNLRKFGRLRSFLPSFLLDFRRSVLSPCLFDLLSFLRVFCPFFLSSCLSSLLTLTLSFVIPSFLSPSFVLTSYLRLLLLLPFSLSLVLTSVLPVFGPYFLSPSLCS